MIFNGYVILFAQPVFKWITSILRYENQDIEKDSAGDYSFYYNDAKEVEDYGEESFSFYKNTHFDSDELFTTLRKAQCALI